MNVSTTDQIEKNRDCLIFKDLDLTLSFTTNIEAEYEAGEYKYVEGPKLSEKEIKKLPARISHFKLNKDISIFS